jgi:uncharacterized protein YkwD
MRFAVLATLALVTSCAGKAAEQRPLDAPLRPVAADSEPASISPPTPGVAAAVGVGVGPARGDGKGKRKMTRDEARGYMVTLINKDRASVGLAPVELDLGPPTVAGQAHAEDMASHGYLGHWGTDGSVPEQRLTEAGGADMVLENALCFVDEHPRTLDTRENQPLIDAEEVERAESMFWNEVPPNDGHRKNIMKPGHRKVGIGVAQPIATPTEIPVPCFTQEFTDPYGTYAALPRKAKVGQTVRVEGTLAKPATVGGVGVARVVTPRPITVADLNKRRSYPVPGPYQMYWPAGFKTPIPVTVTGQAFAIDVPLSDKGEPGLYEVSVWGKLPGSPEFMMLGLRTILVEK